MCSSGSLLAADAPKVTYQDQIRPLFENKCFSCHNPDKTKGGLDLTTYTAAMAGGSGGELVVPGQPGDSRLFKSISHLAEPEMPPEGDKLGKDKIDLVASWITGGLLENSGSKAKKPKPSLNIALAAPSTGKPEGPPPMPEHLALEPAVVTGRAFAPADIASSPWAPLVALAAPKQVLLYDTRNLRLAGVLPFPEGYPQNLAFSRSGGIVIAGGGRGGKLGRVVGWDVKTGRRAFQIGNEFDSVLAADLSADHSLVALGGPSRKLRVFEVASGEKLLEIKKHTDWVTALSFSPDGVLLASGDRSGNLFVWEAGTGNPFYTLKGHGKAITAISWRADSNVVASASEDGSVRLWEMKGGKGIKTWTAHGGGVLDLAYTGDGRLVSCGRDKQAVVWDGGGAQKAKAGGFAEFPVATCLSHDGARFIVADWSGAVKVFNSADGKPAGQLVANPPSIAARLAAADKALGERRAALDAANAAHAAAATALDEGRKAVDAARALVAATKSETGAGAQGVAAADAALKQSEAARNAALQARDVAAAAAATAEAAFAGAATDKVEQLKVESAAAKAALAEKQNALGAAEAAVAAARGAHAAAQQREAQAVTKAQANAKSLADAEAALAAKTKSEAEAKAAIAPAAGAHAAAGKARQLWAAEQINLERHRKSAGRAALVDAVREAEETHARLSQPDGPDQPPADQAAIDALVAAKAAVDGAKAALAKFDAALEAMKASYLAALPK